VEDGVLGELASAVLGVVAGVVTCMGADPHISHSWCASVCTYVHIWQGIWVAVRGCVLLHTWVLGVGASSSIASRGE
jgi:hypothetical protein